MSEDDGIMATETLTAGDMLTKAASIAVDAAKIAKAAQERLAKAPKPVSTEEVEKTAAVLMETGWIPESRKSEIVTALQDPSTTLLALQNLATKAAEVLGTRRDPRLANGTAVGKPETNKEAGESGDRSEADRIYDEKIAGYALNQNRKLS